MCTVSREAEQERVKNKTCLSLFLSPWSLWSLWAEFSQQHNVLWVVTQVKFPSTVISRGAGKSGRLPGKWQQLIFRPPQRSFSGSKGENSLCLEILPTRDLRSKSLTTGAITGEWARLKPSSNPFHVCWIFQLQVVDTKGRWWNFHLDSRPQKRKGECLLCNQIAGAAEMSVLAAIGKKLLVLAVAQSLLVYHINQYWTCLRLIFYPSCKNITTMSKYWQGQKRKDENQGSISPPKSVVSSHYFG